MSDTIEFTDLQLLVYRYDKNVSSYLCVSEKAMRKKVEQLAADFEHTTDEIMDHLSQFGHHEEGDIALLAPDIEMCGEKGNTLPWPNDYSASAATLLKGSQKVSGQAVLDDLTKSHEQLLEDPDTPNHYLVTGHLEGEPADYTRYVVAAVVSDAEEIFKKNLARALLLAPEGPKARVMVTLAVQIPGPPIAIYTEDGVEENPEPIQ